MTAARRWAVVNAWRHASDEEVLRTTPLAMLDGATVAWDSDEVLLYPVTMRGCVAFNYALRYSPAHRWYYYSAMRRDEVLCFKAFGSARLEKDERPSVMFHSAFDLPSEGDGAEPPPPPRKSLEVRCVVCWDDV